MMKESGLEVNVGLIRGKLEDLITFVSTAAKKGTAAHEVERGAVSKSAGTRKTAVRAVPLERWRR